MNVQAQWSIETLIFYIGLSMIIALLFKIAIQKKENKNNLYILIYIILFGLLNFIAVFRYIDVKIGGTDAIAYIKLFNEATLVPFNLIKIITLNGKEYLFYNMFYIFRIFTIDYHYVFFLIYSIIILAYIVFITKNFKTTKRYIVLMLMILPYLNSFNVIRNSFAGAIGLIALNKLKDNKKVTFYILSIIATLIHYTAIILIVFEIYNSFFKKKILKKSKNIKVIYALIIILELILYPVLINYLANSGYSTYLGLQYSLLGYIPILILFIATEITKKDLTKRIEEDENIIFYNAFIFYCLLLPILIPFNGPSRLNIYFEIPRFIIWGYVLDIFQNRIKQFKGRSEYIYNFILTAIIIMWIIFRIFRTWEAAGIMPYYNEIFMR